MKTAAIISEFNPFHNGHRLLIQKAKEAGAERIIALMSSDFVQRGEPALADAAVRTRAALLGGADLVLLSPVRVCTASAERYAAESVAILNALRAADWLVFGSESGALSPLLRMAERLAEEDAGFKKRLREELSSGRGFPAARSLAAGDKDGILSSPNNILAVEYMKALIRSGSALEPLTFPRRGSDYRGLRECTLLPSASGLRKEILSISETVPFPGRADSWKLRIAPGMPSESEAVLREYFTKEPPLSGDALVPALAAVLFSTENPGALTVYEDVDEDLARRMLKMRGQLSGWESFAGLISSRTCTRSHAMRAMLHAALSIRRREHSSLYVQIAGFRSGAADLVSKIRSRSEIPVLISAGRESKALDSCTGEVFAEDLSARNLYRWQRFYAGGSSFCDIRHERVITLAQTACETI